MTEQQIKICAVASVPRLGWQDHWGCIERALRPLGIPVRRASGVFWGRAMQTILEGCVLDGVDWILALDYDTMFTTKHVDRLMSVFGSRPDIDALAPLQCRRRGRSPLLTISGQTRVEYTDQPLQVSTANFGLTLIRVDRLADLPKPWFKSEPDADGRWGDKAVDDDIWFWRQWAEHGRTVYVDPECRVGHINMMVSQYVVRDGQMVAEYMEPREWDEFSGVPGLDQKTGATKPASEAKPEQQGTDERVRLNIGGGKTDLPGFVNVDRCNGQEAYPLTYGDGSVDEVRASHVLEHFSHTQTLAVLTEWARVLKPGGLMRVAVPDFDKVIEAFRSGDPRAEAYLFGGQTDQDDFHHAAFTKQAMMEGFDAAGLVNLGPWDSEIQDCASYPISLNVQGYKPGGSSDEAPVPAKGGFVEAVTERVAMRDPKVVAVISAPRLGFRVADSCVNRALTTCGIEPPNAAKGPSWGPAMQNAIQDAVDAGAELVLTLDYDSIFDAGDLQAMIDLMRNHPDVHALAATQMRRDGRCALIQTMNRQAPRPLELEADLLPATKAHFGLTLLRAAALKRVPLPWFYGRPGPGGSWQRDSGRVDDDIAFWERWAEAKNTLFVANKVRIGHLAEMVIWPGRDLRPVYQQIGEWEATGKPLEVVT